MKKSLFFLFAAVSPALLGQVMTVTVNQDAFSVCPSDVASKRAIECYKLAVDQGHADAQFNLGVMYVNGDGIEQSYSKARELWTKAAAQGDKEAIKGLKKLDKLGL